MRNCTSIREIATPVCGLARNDREIDGSPNSQFVYLLSKADKHILKQECNIRIPKINVKCLIFFMF